MSNLHFNSPDCDRGGTHRENEQDASEVRDVLPKLPAEQTINFNDLIFSDRQQFTNQSIEIDPNSTKNSQTLSPQPYEQAPSSIKKDNYLAIVDGLISLGVKTFTIGTLEVSKVMLGLVTLIIGMRGLSCVPYVGNLPIRHQEILMMGLLTASMLGLAYRRGTLIGKSSVEKSLESYDFQRFEATSKSDSGSLLLIASRFREIATNDLVYLNSYWERGTPKEFTACVIKFSNAIFKDVIWGATSGAACLCATVASLFCIQEIPLAHDSGLLTSLGLTLATGFVMGKIYTIGLSSLAAYSGYRSAR